MTEFTRIQGCGCAAEAAETAQATQTAEDTLARRHHRDQDSCTCCKESLRDALRLLCSGEISSYVNFDTFAYITEANAVGALPRSMGAEDIDNLGPLSGTFRRFTPGTCDLIDIEGTVNTPFGPTVDVEEASLCSLSAIAFQLRAPSGEATSGCCCTETASLLFRRVRDLLQAELEDTCHPCGQCRSGCDCRDDCCCAEGILRSLSNVAMNQRTTLTAGQLSLNGATALGSIGNVLVLANEADSRFYFVCANKIEFMA